MSPTASSDRLCVPCAPDTFSEAPNAASCTACLAGMHQPQSGQSSCYNICSPGTRDTGSGCVECTAGTYQDLAAQTTCKTVRTCPLGWFVANVATPASDVECNPCPSGSYSASINANSCTPCTHGIDFQSTAGQTSCTLLQTCSAGEVAVTVASTIQDRTCQACPGGFFSAESNSDSCSPCPEGQFSPPNSSGCTAFTACTPEQVEVLFPTAEQDRICHDIVHCVPGEFIVQDLDETLGINRQCAPCPAGSFSNTSNSPNCYDCVVGDNYQPQEGQQLCFASMVCLPGSMMQTEATATKNRICADCSPGQVSNSSNAGACASCDGVISFSPLHRGQQCLVTTVCAAGEYIVQPSTPSSNRVCGQCVAGSVSSMENSPNCDMCDGATGYSPIPGGTICMPMNSPCLVDEVEVSFSTAACFK